MHELDVPREVPPVLGLVGAMGAGEGPLPRVGPEVFLQSGHEAELPGAEGAVVVLRIASYAPESSED